MLNKFESHCRSCVFATYIDDWSGPHGMQEGCKLFRIEKFKQKNRTRLSDDGATYIIDGICNTNRGEEWAKSHEGLDLVEKVKEEIHISIDIVILSLKDGIYGLEKRLEKLVDSCVKQNVVKPSRIIVVVQNKDLQFKPLYNDLNALTEPYDIQFQLMQIADQETDISQCVNMAVTKCQSQYTAIFDTSSIINKNFINNFNRLINSDLKRIVLVEPVHSYSGMIIQTKLFRLMGKNHDAPIFTKIQEVCEGKNTDLIITWKDLCPQK